MALGLGPALSPDGSTVLFVRLVGARGAEVVLLDLASGGVRVVAHYPGRVPDVETLTWSSDSRSAGYVTDSSIELIDRVTGRVSTVESFPAGERPEGLSFAPEGSAVAFVLGTPSGGDLHVLDLLTHETTRLTDDGGASDPLWGPDGIFVSRGFAEGDIWLLSRDGSEQQKITDFAGGVVPIAVSADGKRLLAGRPPTHNGQIFAIDVPARAVRPLTPVTGELRGEGISRDGRSVLAAVGCVGPPGQVKNRIQVLSFDTGKIQVEIDGGCQATWNA
ncbi:MAG: hypothetical protein U0R69_03700 [Gaiellales bacterium]